MPDIIEPQFGVSNCLGGSRARFQTVWKRVRNRVAQKPGSWARRKPGGQGALRPSQAIELEQQRPVWAQVVGFWRLSMALLKFTFICFIAAGQLC